MRLDNALTKMVVVDPRTLGNKLRLVSVRPYYTYVDGHRTDDLAGYNYIVTCSGLDGERLAVKIAGNKQLLDVDSYDRLVRFAGLDIGIYPSYVKGQRGIDAINIKASATGISVIGD